MKRCFGCLPRAPLAGGQATIVRVLADQEDEFFTSKNERLAISRRSSMKREYRFATLFGAGSGLSAMLGMMYAAIEESVESGGGYLTYLAFDGVSAGALICMFLAHVNVLDPYEMMNEIKYIMNLGDRGLKTGAFNLWRKPWVFFCAEYFSSVINFDKFFSWLSKEILTRRQKVMEYHKRHNVKCTYAFIRVMCSTEYGPQIMCHRSGDDGAGFDFHETLTAAINSARIPLLAPGGALGANGLLSKGAFDGGITAMAVPPHHRMIEMLASDRPHELLGVDAYCANSKTLLHKEWRDEDYITGPKRKKLTVDATLAFFMDYMIWNGCNESITKIEDTWNRMISFTTQRRYPVVRIFRNAGTGFNKDGTEVAKPNMSHMDSDEYIQLYEKGKEYCIEQCKKYNQEIEEKKYHISKVRLHY